MSPRSAGRQPQHPSRPSPKRFRGALFLGLLACLAGPAAAEVVGVEIHSRELVLDGEPFGEAGAYELVQGSLLLALDPALAANGAICDLERAPTDAEGRVPVRADLMVLQAVDPDRRRGTGLFEVSNRGGKATLSYFQGARYSLAPTEPEHFGDGLLLRRGWTLVWVGWQFDVPPGEGRLRLDAPVAREEDGPIEGLVRCDWTVDEESAVLELGHRGHLPYRVLEPEGPEHRLSVRAGRSAQRVSLPRERWSFDGAGLDGRPTRIRLEGGFEAGQIYELVYEAVEPSVVGVGLAALRDAASYAKHDPDALFPLERTLAVGISQTGRFLRHFLWQGFNADEAGRRAFDGLLIHTAGAGRGSFNHRFAQPSRDAHRYSAFFYPTDVFPFTSRTQRDPLNGMRGGLFERARAQGVLPKVFATNTGYEYWGRAASLLHTSLDGSNDVPPLPEERLYHLAGAQHFVGPFPPPAPWRIGTAAWRGNPLDFKPTLRALLLGLEAWVAEGAEPPPSRVPTIDAGTLVALDELADPKIPGVPLPAVAHEAVRAQYGPRFWSEGIVERQPPGIGAPFAVRVPQLDPRGNELGGVPTLDLLAPLASYLPWYVRRGEAGGNGELADFFGTFAPFPRTSAEARERRDPRPDIQSLYGTREAYRFRAQGAAASLVSEGFLLEEDRETVVARALATWDWIHDQ